MSEPAEFEVRRDQLALRGSEEGEGPPIVLAHGLTATRRYVVHGSRALVRAGHRLISYDARGHGESDPAGEGGYGYPQLADDLAAIVEERIGDDAAILVGHSMGTHTIATLALSGRLLIAAVVLIGPATVGTPLEPDGLEGWDRLADALERDGVEGFVRAIDNPDLEEHWRETIARITRERLDGHRHIEAVAQALREVPRSLPFAGIAELELLDIPALVVASRDEADPGHPYAVAEAWAESLPNARLISEPEGSSPLAWQGGRLSREVAAFASEPEVRARLERT